MGKRKKLPLSCCCATRGNTVLCAKKCLLMLLLFFIHKSQLFQNDHIKYLFLSGLIWLPLWMMPGAGWGAGPRCCLGNGWRGWEWLRMRCWTGGCCFGLYGDWGCCLRAWSYDQQDPENRGTERLKMVARVSTQGKRGEIVNDHIMQIQIHIYVNKQVKNIHILMFYKKINNYALTYV